MQHRYFGAFHFLRAICVHISYTNTIFEVEMHEQSVSLLVKRSPHKYYSASAYSFFFFFCHWYQIFRLLHFIQDFNNWEATGECAMLLVACFRMGGYTPVGHGKRYVHIAS